MELTLSGDAHQIRELVTLATVGKKSQCHDAIKVLYEIGARAPDLIAPHALALIDLLTSNDNRTLWGVLQALDTITATCPEIIMAHLNIILDATDRSSVIARDKTMSILCQLNGDPKFSETISPIILQRLSHAAANQFPTYAQLAAKTLTPPYFAQLRNIIKSRQKSIASPAKRKRLEKVLVDVRPHL